MDETKLNELVTTVGQLATAVGEMKAKIDAPPAGNPGAGSNPLKDIEVKDVKNPKPFKSMGEQLVAVVKHATNQGHDTRLDQVNDAIKASGMNESVGSEGGFALQNDFTTALLDPLYQSNDPMAIVNRMTRQPIGPGANGFTAVMIDETSRATTRRGGMLGYWLPEGGTKTASKPALRQFELKLGKVTVLSYLTDELIQDVAALEAMVMREGPAELQFQVEDAGVNGNGAGKPLGVLASPCLVTVAKENGQPAATILYENIVKMWSRMPGRNRANAAWFINQDVEPQLFSMSLAVGTGGAPAYLPANGLSEQPFGTLFGRPVIPVEYCPTLGTVGDIIFADWAEYMLIDKGGVQTASSIHVQFLTDETVLRFVYRVNGAPLWNAPLTPFKGSNTLSPFVALATRS